MTDEQINHMINRFLGWKLPHSFNPDGGISFKGNTNPVGTNLFTAQQASEMIRYLIQDMPD